MGNDTVQSWCECQHPSASAIPINLSSISVLFLCPQAFRIANNDIGLAELLDFVDKSYSDVENEAMNDVAGSVYLPVASLLTGINKPDHHEYFKNLCDRLARRNGTHTVVLPARDCPSVKSTIEILVSCVLSNGRKNNYRDDEEVNPMKGLNRKWNCISNRFCAGRSQSQCFQRRSQLSWRWFVRREWTRWKGVWSRWAADQIAPKSIHIECAAVVVRPEIFWPRFGEAENLRHHSEFRRVQADGNRGSDFDSEVRQPYGVCQPRENWLISFHFPIAITAMSCHSF